jgi:hypothetical protein
MKTGFPNPIDKTTHKEQKSPFNFEQPHYDERSSCYVNAGSHHGVGHKQPVGHHGDPKQDVPCLPKGKVKTMKDDEIIKKNLRIEMQE